MYGYEFCSANKRMGVNGSWTDSMNTLSWLRVVIRGKDVPKSMLEQVRGLVFRSRIDLDADHGFISIHVVRRWV
jgi:hypothetical protein